MLALTETPMPTPSMTVDPVSVTPGFVGFAMIVVIVIAVILLIWDMNRRIRRVRYRDEVREELDAEEAARAAAGAQADTSATGSTEVDGSSTHDEGEEPPAR
jgi:hypothetical protein